MVKLCNFFIICILWHDICMCLTYGYDKNNIKNPIGIPSCRYIFISNLTYQCHIASMKIDASIGCIEACVLQMHSFLSILQLANMVTSLFNCRLMTGEIRHNGHLHSTLTIKTEQFTKSPVELPCHHIILLSLSSS